MRYRPIDENGDMMPVNTMDDMKDGASAVLLAVHSRMRLLQGEWWEDRSLGFRIPQILFDGTRMPYGVASLANYITSYIAQTEGVTAVTEVLAYMEDRVMHYSCAILTGDGQIEGRIEQDVLLRAIY